jgi:hypothetical protein
MSAASVPATQTRQCQTGQQKNQLHGSPGRSRAGTAVAAAGYFSVVGVCAVPPIGAAAGRVLIVIAGVGVFVTRVDRAIVLIVTGIGSLLTPLHRITTFDAVTELPVVAGQLLA